MLMSKREFLRVAGHFLARTHTRGGCELFYKLRTKSYVLLGSKLRLSEIQLDTVRFSEVLVGAYCKVFLRTRWMLRNAKVQ